MARKAREKELYSVYLIEQGCSGDEVFACQKDENAFVESLISAQKQYGFLLLAAEMGNCFYRLMLFDNGSDISKIMRSINIRYSLCIKRESSKFKSRFKSRILSSKEELLQEIQCFTRLDEIYANRLVEGNACANASRFKTKYFNEGYEEFLTYKTQLLPCVGSHCHHSKDLSCIETVEACSEFLEKALKQNDLTLDSLSKDKAFRDSLILEIRRRSNLTLKQIGVLFGGMSESAISKIIKRRT